MKNSVILIVLITTAPLFSIHAKSYSSRKVSDVLFEEYFTSGTADQVWIPLPGSRYNDNLNVVSDPSTPGGDSWVGELSDTDGNFRGIAMVYAQPADLTDITIEADVYCKDLPQNGASVQSGICARIDSSTDVRYSQFYCNLQDDQISFLTHEGFWYDPEYGTRKTHTWTGITAPSGWHKMKVTLQKGWVTCYFDDMNNPLPGCPVYFPTLEQTLTMGEVGLGVSNYNYTGNPGASSRYDNIIVSKSAQLATLSGNVNFSDSGTTYPAVIWLYRSFGSDPVTYGISPKGGGAYCITNVPLGTYDMVFLAPGYHKDETTHQDIKVLGEKISGLDVTLEPSSGETFSIMGKVSFSGDLATTTAQIEAYLDDTDYLVGETATEVSTGNYILKNMPSGIYDVVVKSSGYFIDKTTFSDLEIIDQNPTNRKVILYPPDYNVYRGNLHSHTSYSDGMHTPAAAYSFGKNIAKIDFLAVTDHVHLLSQSEYDDTKLQGDYYTQDGVFVGILGYEWAINIGHANVFEDQNILNPPDLDGFYTELVSSGSPGTFNHPIYLNFQGLPYSSLGDQRMCLMEVRKNSEQEGYFKALNKGWHIGVDGSEDNHGPNWGAGSLTGLLATKLTKSDLLVAIEQRRSLSSSDRNLELILMANGHWMGEIFSCSSDFVTFDIKVYDPDIGDKFSGIHFYQDGKKVSSMNPMKRAYTWIFDFSAPSYNQEHYFMVKGVQADGDMVWSAPIWITFHEKTGFNDTWLFY